MSASLAATGRQAGLRPQQDTRALILLAAASQFRDKGYKATTLRDIAEALRMSPANVYYYFASKEAMLQEVLDLGLAAIDAAVHAAVEGLPAAARPVERLRAAILASLAALLGPGEYSTTYVQMYNQLPPGVKRRDHPRRLAYLAYWAGLLDAAAACGEIRLRLPTGLAVEFLLGALSRSTEWVEPSQVELPVLTGAIADWLLNGIAGKE